MKRLIVTIAASAILSVAAPQIASADFGIAKFDATFVNQDGSPAVSAGSRPFAFNFSLRFATTLNGKGESAPDGSVKDIEVDLPRGIAGDFTQLPRCTNEELVGQLGSSGSDEECPIDSQAGVLKVYLEGDESEPLYAPLYNMVPPPGTPADFGAPVAGVATIRITPSVRTGADYGITASSLGTSSLLPILGADVSLWGVPSDASHDTERYPCLSNDGPGAAKCPVTFPPFPLLTMPTACEGPLVSRMRADSWQQIGDFDEAFSESHDDTGHVYGLHGCGLLGFSPTLTARPETAAADSPTGMHFNIHLPQNDNPSTSATAHLRETRIELPEGLTVNPSSATGLEGCSADQVDLDGPNPAQCPNTSKIGAVRVHTPLVDNVLEGAIYVAKPFDNPFDALIALYLSFDDPQTGIVVKLAGEVITDPVTGQISTVFSEIPQFAIEDVEVNLFGGPRASLRTPRTCGSYATSGDFTPWSAPEAPDASSADAFEISLDSDGSSCTPSEFQLPHDPAIQAGTAFPLAKMHSPFALDLRRADGSREWTGLEVTLPPGLAATFAGLTYCSPEALAAAAVRSGRAEQASPSCPASSRVGVVNTGAGAGPSPLITEGVAYLAGPYKGAQLSLATVVPAVAGPFDLGTVVVRAALPVNRATGQATAISDPLPVILEGIPLDVRSIGVNLDRPGFTLNPTNCSELSITSRIFAGTALATPSTRFQVGGCGALGLDPRIDLRLLGSTKRLAHPTLKTTITPRPGDANLKSFQLALPSGLLLDQAALRTVCTRVQFAADSCPAGSVYGSAVVTTPLFDAPLSGDLILRSSSNLLPDLVIDLHGQVDIESVGRIDTTRGGLRSTFDLIPDAPVNKVVVTLPGGSRGLLIASTGLCKKPLRATAKISAHNDRRRTEHPKLRASCKTKAKHKAKRHGRR